MGNAIFIVWRECLEAVLIISILYTYLSRQREILGLFERGRRFIAIGVGIGIVLSLALAYGIVMVQDGLAGEALEYFQIGVLLLSAGLMTQMVFWMRKHGRTMKRELEQDCARAIETSKFWGIAGITAVAVAREGAETVVYFYGMAYEGALASKSALFTAGLSGLALALVTAMLVAKGIRVLNYATFFRITGIFLLVSAAGLISASVGKLIELELLPTLANPLWNTTYLLDPSSLVGGLLASFAGYRPRPSGMLVLIYAGYWVAVGFGIWRSRQNDSAADRFGLSRPAVVVGISRNL